MVTAICFNELTAVQLLGLHNLMSRVIKIKFKMQYLTNQSSSELFLSELLLLKGDSFNPFEIFEATKKFLHKNSEEKWYVKNEVIFILTLLLLVGIGQFLIRDMNCSCLS